MTIDHSTLFLTTITHATAGDSRVGDRKKEDKAKKDPSEVFHWDMHLASSLPLGDFSFTRPVINDLAYIHQLTNQFCCGEEARGKQFNLSYKQRKCPANGNIRLGVIHSPNRFIDELAAAT